MGASSCFCRIACPSLHNLSTGKLEAVRENPYAARQPLVSGGCIQFSGVCDIALTAPTRKHPRASMLPLFSYGAVGWHAGGFRSAVILVDDEPRQDLRFMKTEDVIKGIKMIRKQMPANRLRAHLEHCAMTYGCPAGKNFFLGRYEAPLPTLEFLQCRVSGVFVASAAGRSFPTARSALPSRPRRMRSPKSPFIISTG